MAKKSKEFKKTIESLKQSQIQSVEQNLMGYSKVEKQVYDNIQKAVMALPAEKVLQGEVPISEMVKLELPDTKDESLSKLVFDLQKRITEVQEELKNVELKSDEKPTATRIDTEEEFDDSNKIKNYKFADKIRKYSIGDLIAENVIEGKSIKSSITSAISAKTKATFTDIKKSFDPLNIAKRVSGRGGAAILGKLLGRDRSELEYFGERYRRKGNRASQFGGPVTATKISKLGSQSKGNYGAIVAILKSIYNFLEKNRNEDVRLREEEDSKKQDEFDLKEKRHKELLEAISKLTGAPIGVTVTKDDSSGGGLLDGLSGVLGGTLLGKLGTKLRGKFPGKVAAGVTEGAIEGAAKTATKVSRLLEGAKSILRFLEKIPGLSLIAAGAALLWDVKNAIERHESGEIDEQQLKKEIITAIGGGLGGLGGAEVGGLLGGAVGSVVPGAGTLVGGILGGAAGFFGGEKLGKVVAEKMFDFFASGKEVEPPSDPKLAGEALSSQSTKAQSYTPTATPVPPTSPISSASTSASNSPPPAMPAKNSSTAAPIPSSNAGAKLNQATQSNQVMKLDSATSGGTTVINNTSAGKGGDSSGIENSKQPLPSVRNKESTFERLIYNSTRVV